MELLIGSQQDTTNFFALDIPVRIHGRFDNPDFAPARWSSEGRSQMAAADDIASMGLDAELNTKGYGATTVNPLLLAHEA